MPGFTASYACGAARAPSVHARFTEPIGTQFIAFVQLPITPARIKAALKA